MYDLDHGFPPGREVGRRGQARLMAAFFTADPTGQASPPSVIADAVAKAVTRAAPAPRYAVGRGAKPILAARRVLSDRAFDRLMHRVLRGLNRVAARQAA